jgi:zinc/manganese transport system substrate-binding protein
MRSFASILLAITLLLGSGAARADLEVVATTPDLASVAMAIGGAHAKVSALALPTQDPHWVDARPHLALKLARADMLLVVGLGLEVGWLPTLLTGSRNLNVQNGGRGHVDCSELIEPLEVAQARIDRSQGDVHAGGNPHYMFDPRAAAQVIDGVAARMAVLDPPNAGTYRANAASFKTRLATARIGWEKQLSGLRGAKVIDYHKSFPYLESWLGFHVVEHLEPRPGIPPNPRHVAQVLALAKQQKVRIVLQESFYPDRTGQLVATQAGAKLVRIPAGPDLSARQGYIEFMGQVVALLRGATD